MSKRRTMGLLALLAVVSAVVAVRLVTTAVTLDAAARSADYQFGNPTVDLVAGTQVVYELTWYGQTRLTPADIEVVSPQGARLAVTARHGDHLSKADMDWRSVAAFDAETSGRYGIAFRGPFEDAVITPSRESITWRALAGLGASVVSVGALVALMIQAVRGRRRSSTTRSQ